MSEPTPVALRPHHGYKSWTTTWYDDQGHHRTKRFGKESEVSRLEANAKYQRWLNNEYQSKAHVRNPDDPASVTVEKLADEYEAFAKTVFVKDGEPTGHMSNVHYGMLALKESHGPQLANDIDYPKIVRLCNAMCYGKGGKRLSVKTVNGRLFCIKAAFAWGRGKEWVSAVALNDVQNVPPLIPGRCDARESREVPPVADAIVERTKKHLPRVVCDMIDVQALTGMRPGETCAMRACDIDVSDIKVWVYSPASHKTKHKKKLRRIAIGPRAQKILAPYLHGRQLTDYLFSPAEAQQQRRDAATKKRVKDGTPLSCGNGVGTNRVSRPKVKPGRRYDNQSYRKAIRYACRAVEREIQADDPKATFPAWFPHQIRHTAGTKARERDGYEAAVDLLGHSSPSTTAIYAEWSLERAKKLARKVG